MAEAVLVCARVSGGSNLAWMYSPVEVPGAAMIVAVVERSRTTGTSVMVEVWARNSCTWKAMLVSSSTT